jgi:hypothetical protein
MLQALISSLLLETYPDTLAIANIANGTMYINPLSTTLGRYPVTIELNPGLKNEQYATCRFKITKQILFRNNLDQLSIKMYPLVRSFNQKGNKCLRKCSEFIIIKRAIV